MTKDSFNKIVLTLLEGTVTLYPAKPDLSPQLDSPLWSGAPAEGLVVRETWLEVQTRPTGAPYPVNHPLIQQYEINLERVWQLPLEQLEDFAPAHTNYVLDITWQDEDGGQWHRRTFYGVTIRERSLATRDIESGSTDGQVFAAQSLAIEVGQSGPIPPISATPPYRVLWRGADGTRTLYSYNPATHLFTAVGDTTGRATIGYDGGGVWQVTFAGGDPVVVSVATGLQAVFLEAMPDNAQLPRLDFIYGTLRLASITPAGLWARAFDDTATPVSAGGQFDVYYAGSLVATLAAPEVAADEFIEP